MEETKEKKEDKEKNKERFELVEVPTETGVFVKDNNSKEVLDDKAVLVQILNKLENIEKSVAD